MSGRIDKMERRRQERVERERERDRAERRQRLRAVALAGVLGLLGVSAVTGLLVYVGAQSGPPQAEASGPFGQHYRGLEGRQNAAGIPTMATTESDAHSHARLRIYADGKPIPVPANIGIDPARDSTQMAVLHTHEGDGTLHAEGIERATLGQFFSIWGVALSAQRLGPYRATAAKSVRMWVDGRPSRSFGTLALRDKQQIVISFGVKGAPAPAEIDR